MRQEDFFYNEDDPFFGDHKKDNLKRALLESVIRNENINQTDLELAEPLIPLLHSELESFANNGYPKIRDDDDMVLLIRTCRVVCSRIGLSFPELPFRDRSSFRRYWLDQGMTGSYERRREYLRDLFEHLELQVAHAREFEMTQQLAVPVNGGTPTGWARIDREVSQLRASFAAARTEKDHSAVGHACTRIVEELGVQCFDETLDVLPGASVPPRDKTKIRLDAVINRLAQGSENDDLRRVARATIEFSQTVKHRSTPTRRDAGIVADTTIQLVNIMRRLIEPTT